MTEYDIVRIREWKKGLLNPKEMEAPKELGLFLYGIIGLENRLVEKVIYQAEGRHEGKWNIR